MTTTGILVTVGLATCPNNNKKTSKTDKMADQCTITLKKGKVIRLKAQEYNIEKKIKHHKSIGFESTDKRVVSITQLKRTETYRSMKIKAKKRGRCKLYIYAQNGVYMTINLIVK